MFCFKPSHAFIFPKMWEKQGKKSFYNFVQYDLTFCNFFSPACPILKDFGLETEHLFYKA